MARQVCTNCGEEKPVHEFSWKDKARARRQSQCKACHAEYRKRHYLENRSKYIAKAKKWNQANYQHRRAHLREYVRDYLLSHPCVDCGESDIVVLDFDHVRGNKRNGISNMIRLDVSLELLIAEIQKCEVRCANCHRRRTARQNNWWSLDC